MIIPSPFFWPCRALALAVFCSAAPVSAYAAEYCALTVTIEDPYSGKPANLAHVEVRAGGRVVASKTTSTGTAEFCNLGFQLHDVSVGGELCGGVTVKGLTPQWPEGRKIRILHSNCHNGFAGTGWCTAMVRLPSGAVFDRAVLHEPEEPLQADGHGRIFFMMRKGTIRRGEATSPRSGKRAFELKCDKEQFLELVVGADDTQLARPR